MEPSFYAVIPATVRYNKNLSDGSKLLYGEITALCNKMGYCWATNEYFSKLYDCSERTISRWISSLAREGFLLTIVDKDDSNARKIWLPETQNINIDHRQKCPDPMDKNVYTYRQKCPDPMDKNVYNNNTINNTKNNTIESKADKPQPTPKNETKTDQSLNENPKKPNNFNGRGAAKKTTTYTPKIHAENEPHFAHFSDPEKAKAAWTEWIEYKHTQHREKYKEPKTELAKLRQLFKQFHGDATKFEEAVNYSIGNLYKGIFAPKIENGNGKFQHLDKAQQQHIKLARFVADIHSGTAFANTGTVDIITGE